MPPCSCLLCASLSPVHLPADLLLTPKCCGPHLKPASLLPSSAPISPHLNYFHNFLVSFPFLSLSLKNKQRQNKALLLLRVFF